MAHVLQSPEPLSRRAQAFLAEHAHVVDVDTGPDDEQCRADMRAAFGHSDEEALAELRRVQRRYSGLTYPSPFRGGQIVLEPVFEAGPGMDRIEFWYAVMDAVPDGYSSGSMLPDGTVRFGMFDHDVPVFPPLDHFLECDALLHFASSLDHVSTEGPSDLTAHLAMVHARHPALRRLDRESGYCVEWWSDGEVLVYVSSLEARLAPAHAPGRPTPPVVKTWSWTRQSAASAANCRCWVRGCQA